MVGYKMISKAGFSDDLRAGFVLFLIALPLCVGISLASGAPASAGIIAGVVGGIVGSLLGGCRLAINGPAAGMIVVVVNGIATLSDGDPRIGFQRFLACVMVVGVLQILAGMARLGRFALLAPSAVVHGMMVAIGTIILIKQFPVLLGVKPHARDLIGMVVETPTTVAHLVWPVAAIGAICLGVMLAWQAFPARLIRLMPGPLLAVAVGLAFSMRFDVLRPEDLVPLPTEFAQFLIFPLFDQVLSARSLEVILTVFLVGSLESQLSTLAVDQLDPLKRASDFDQEFIGKGAVNFICGMVGGLPVITEIVRSSANIANGAKSPLSNLIHGSLLGLAVILVPGLMRQIPLTSLAAVLLLIGWRLARLSHFVAAWRAGKDVFVAFAVTWGVTIVDDLLVGLALGFVVYVAMQLWRGVKPHSFWRPDILVHREGAVGYVEVRGSLVFSGYLSVLSACNSMPDLKEIRLDLGQVTHLDHGVRHNLEGLVGQMGAAGQEVEVIWPSGKKAA
jgi:MFS superfamily sulfate permease-like transporter